MKRDNKTKWSLAFFALLLIQLMVSCETHSILPETPKDYFPLSDNFHVNYLKENIFGGENETVWASDTVTLTVLADTLVEGLSYKRVINDYGFLDKIVRKEGSRYFGRNHEFYGGFSHEYMFLDTKAPVDSSWVYIKDNGNTKTEYVIREVNANHTINGVEYKDVIKLDVNYYNNRADGINFELGLSSKHYYANGIGEIYAYYPPYLSGMYNSVRLSVLPAN
jgi:hypothetical protein